MATPEAIASAKCRLIAGLHKCRLFRNNAGMFYNEHGQPVYFGLGNSNKKVAGKKVSEIRKSSDDIGYTSVTITPEMVGHKIAVFTTIEMKAEKFKIRDVYPKKTRESKQDAWNKMCIKAGGIGGFAKDKESMDEIFAKFYARFK